MRNIYREKHYQLDYKENNYCSVTEHGIIREVAKKRVLSHSESKYYTCECFL